MRRRKPRYSAYKFLCFVLRKRGWKAELFQQMYGIRVRLEPCTEAI